MVDAMMMTMMTMMMNILGHENKRLREKKRVATLVVSVG
jgi:hypothetical protein